MHLQNYFTPLLMGFILIVLWSCGNAKKEENQALQDSIQAVKEWNKSIQGAFSDQQDLHFDSTQLDTFLVHYPDFQKFDSIIHHFYQARNHAFAWFDQKGLIEQAGNLIDRVSNIEADGIRKPLPYKKALDSLVLEHTQRESPKPNTELEFMLTAQYFSFAQIVWNGMDASVSRKADWFLPRKSISYEAYLDSLLKSPPQQTITQDPVYRQYDLLRSFLSKYRALEKNNWSILEMESTALRLGDSASIVSQIEERLYLLGDIQNKPDDRMVYDSALATGVIAFQKRMGLTADGVLGKATLAELNVPPQERVKTILVNMERSRWLPIRLQEDYLAVNIPEFKLHVYHADSLLWSTPVVVGKDIHKTVVFSGEIQYVVFSPYWNVPVSIVRNEIMPAMRRNRNYIASKNMEITGYQNGIPIVRQKPGPDNSLGLVKFLFPNSHNIYLHDSPAKSLFQETSRAFSHGCVRVQEPEKLAVFLLKQDSSWTEEKIHEAMHSKQEKWVTLQKKVPVFLTYFTAFVSREGQLNFRKDIYNRDARLAEMLISD